jgi:hypothetical protein
VLSTNRQPGEIGLQLTVGSGTATGAAGGNAMADCLPLSAALEAESDATLSLPLGPQSVLHVRVQRAAAQKSR